MGAGSRPYDVALASLNADGHPDLPAANPTTTLNVPLNTTPLPPNPADAASNTLELTGLPA